LALPPDLAETLAGSSPSGVDLHRSLWALPPDLAETLAGSSPQASIFIGRCGHSRRI
jgi:hypothetical protein